MWFSFRPFSPALPVLAIGIFLSACGSGTPASHRSTAEDIPALSALNDSIRQFPGEAGLFLRRGERLSQISAHELAYADYKKAWSLNPSPATALALAANLQVLGKDSERLDLLRTGNTRFPDDPQLHRLLADAYAGGGDRQQALKQYADMLLKNPEDFETLYEQGLLLEQLNDTPAAITALKKAYALKGVATYGLELAHLYAEQKNDTALSICNEILREDTGNLLIDPLFIKGIYYANMKLYPQAIVQFDSCIGRDWKTTDAYLEKGMAYFHLQKFDAGINTFQMAITVSPSDPDAHYWLGRCYEATHRKTDAIGSYEKTLQLDTGFSDAREAIRRLQPGFGDASH